MKPINKLTYLKHLGVTLIIFMIFVFSVPAVSTASPCGASIQIVDNEQKAYSALLPARSLLNPCRALTQKEYDCSESEI